MRLILIDNSSGNIFGDTAAMPRDHVIDGSSIHEWGDALMTPVLAARWLDEAIIGHRGRKYENVLRLASTETGYRVYRADIDGSEAVPVFEDGTDLDAITTVERDCEWIGCVRCSEAGRR